MGHSSENSKAFEKLNTIIKTKLHETIYGKNSKDQTKEIATVDHSRFHDIYKAELSKAIVDLTTDYCSKVNISNFEESFNKCNKNAEEECKKTSSDAEAFDSCKKESSISRHHSCHFFYYYNSDLDTKFSQ